MYRIRIGTKPKRRRQVWLFSALLPHTLPRLMIQRGGASLLFSFTYEMVCLVRGGGSPFYSLQGRFPPKAYMEGDQEE